MPDTEREVAERITDRQLCQEAFVLARGAIRQTAAMRKQGGSDEEIAMLCDLLKEYDRIVKSEFLEHLLPRLTTARQQQREVCAGIADLWAQSRGCDSHDYDPCCHVRTGAAIRDLILEKEL